MMPGKHYSEPTYGDLTHPEGFYEGGGGRAWSLPRPETVFLSALASWKDSRRLSIALPSTHPWPLQFSHPYAFGSQSSRNNWGRGKNNPGESLALPLFGRSGRNMEMYLPGIPPPTLQGCWAYLSQPGSVCSRPAFPSAPPPACACVCARERRRGATTRIPTQAASASVSSLLRDRFSVWSPSPPRPAHPRFSLRSKSAFPPLGPALFSWVGSCVDLPPGPRGII